MGTYFNTKIITGPGSREEIAEKFDVIQSDCRYENGHSYSGGFGMACGLAFHDKDVFESEAEARKYLIVTCQKWGEAIAVRFASPDGTAVSWMIGAWCAS